LESIIKSDRGNATALGVTTAVTRIRIFFDRDFDVRGKIALRDFSDEHGYFDPGNPHDQH
jgi:hypothetical protein